MNLLQACQKLEVWSIAKIHAELWQMDEDYHLESLQSVKVKAKASYKKMARNHHPDVGGDSEIYLEIQRANDVIKSSTISDFITALKEESELKKLFFEPGSKECAKCVSWSTIVNSCITVTCSSLKEHKRSSQ